MRPYQYHHQQIYNIIQQYFFPLMTNVILCYNIEFNYTNAVKYLQHAFPLNHAKSFFSVLHSG